GGEGQGGGQRPAASRLVRVGTSDYPVVPVPRGAAGDVATDAGRINIDGGICRFAYDRVIGVVVDVSFAVLHPAQPANVVKVFAVGVGDARAVLSGRNCRKRGCSSFDLLMGRGVVEGVAVTGLEAVRASRRLRWVVVGGGEERGIGPVAVISGGDVIRGAA